MLIKSCNMWLQGVVIIFLYHYCYCNCFLYIYFKFGSVSFCHIFYFSFSFCFVTFVYIFLTFWQILRIFFYYFNCLYIYLFSVFLQTFEVFFCKYLSSTFSYENDMIIVGIFLSISTSNYCWMYLFHMRPFWRDQLSGRRRPLNEARRPVGFARAGRYRRLVDSWLCLI